MEMDAAETGLQSTRAGLEDIINPADDDNVVVEIRSEEVLRDRAGLEKESEDYIVVDGDADDNNQKGVV